MSKILKYFYIFITSTFILLTIYEIVMYMKLDSNYLGIFYLFFNFFIMFLLFTMTYNYSKANKNIRVSKNIIVVVLGVFASFVLSLLLPHIFNYTDDSYLFNDYIFVISKILKPILYLLLAGVSVVEIKCVK